MITIAIILFYILGIFVFIHLDRKFDVEGVYFSILSWPGVLILGFCLLVDKYEEYLNNKNKK